MSEISIWPLRKTWLSTWWQNPCWQSQRSDISCSWPPGLHISGGILSHSSLQILSKSLRFRGWRLATRTFSCLHRFSMGLRSGDWLGHSRTLMLLLEPLLCCLGHVFWVIVMLEYPSTTHFQCPGWFQCPGPDGTWPRPSSLWCSAVVLSP